MRGWGVGGGGDMVSAVGPNLLNTRFLHCSLVHNFSLADTAVTGCLHFAHLTLVRYSSWWDGVR
jgi:hypothetical protein